MKTPLKRARPAAKVVAATRGKTGKSATQKLNQKSDMKPAAKAKPANLKASAARSTRASTTAVAAAKSPSPKTAAAKTVSQLSLPEPTTKNATALRATKKRAPKDLANQYGQSDKAARAEMAATAPRKRRNAATRARLQAVITPDDDLLLRLARAGAISTSHAPENENGAGDKRFRAPVKRRSRKWETRCGKCGVSAQYAAAAALCVRCGAILVRE